MSRLFRRARGLIALALLLGGCASPSERMDRTAARLGLIGERVRGDGYTLIAYRNRIVRPGGRLHIYLEGDGKPWITRYRIARDPTPRNPLALHLMAHDQSPAVYLGRPCYNGTAGAPGCSPLLWTSGRYSQTVLSAMAAATRTLIAAAATREVALIGYSGGGVLAWLLAQRIPQVRVLVTIAANLDIDRWTDKHGYSRLTGSLNPAAGPPMRPEVEQWHLVGRDDQNVPPAIIHALARQLGPDAHVLIAASDHRCCWVQIWPDILRKLP